MGAISSRLNVWWRLFIVVTILWLVGATYWLWFSQVSANYEAAATVQHLCEETNGRDCNAEYSRRMTEYGDQRLGLLGVTFLVVLVGTSAIWGVIGIAYLIVRWILAGRNIEISN